MRRTALVTGGAGFIGSHLCESLVREDWEVWALDDLSTGRPENVASLATDPRFHLSVESVLRKSVLSELVHRCDVVFHLAAAVGVKLIVEQAIGTIMTNVRGTENVLEYVEKFDKRVLIASTSEVYGQSDGVGLVETAERRYGPTTQRRWAYAASKAIDEFLALAYQQELGTEVVVARLFNCAGPRQRATYGMVVPRFVQAALRDEPLQVYGDGEQTRCFCHVYDVVDALEKLMDEDDALGEIVNVGNEQAVSINALAGLVIGMSDTRSEVEYVPMEQVYGQGIVDVPERSPSIEKARELIGWEPELSLPELVEDVIAYELGGVATDVSVR